MKYCNSTSISRLASSLALGFSLLADSAQAAPILSMTIEEIGVASGGLGTSAMFSLAGEFSVDEVTLETPVGFGSSGSTDGAILMDIPQGNGAFSPGFDFLGLPATPNTTSGAPSGSISGSMLALGLSGWGVNWGTSNFMLPPDTGTLSTAVSMIDSTHFYYTADWTHLITQAENSAFAGFTTRWHLEGIATTVPEPGTLWLLGASALGLMLSRRSKLA